MVGEVADHHNPAVTYPERQLRTFTSSAAMYKYTVG
jgi:hypothetical protein